MASEFTEDQIKAMIFGLEEENDKIVEEEPRVAEVQLPQTQTTQVPPPAPVDMCSSPAMELPQQTAVNNGDYSGRRRISHSCPVPECGGKVVVNLWNHLFQTHKASGKYTDNELREFLREAKRRVPTATRRATRRAPKRQLVTVVEGQSEGNGPKRRRGWIELEEAIITAHFGLIESRKTPSLEQCQQFLLEFSNETLFKDRKKKEIQDKCRTIMKNCKHSYTPT